jgi:ribosomal protein S18 acetylase RimI-like enzyme
MGDMLMHLRPARPDEALALARLAGRCDVVSGLPDQVEEDAAKLAERIADEDHWVAVAMVDGAVAGFACVRPGGAPTLGHLSNLFVEPELWGRGVGAWLLARAVDEMRARGWAEAELSVAVDNERARGFYERAGWRDSGARHGGNARYVRALGAPRKQHQ